MPSRCCVLGCNNNYDKKKKVVGNVSVFLFPKLPQRREHWLKCINRGNFVVTDHSAVCIEHFEERFIIREDSVTRPDGSVLTLPRQKLKLSDDAFPSKFLNQPKYLSLKLPTIRRDPNERAAAIELVIKEKQKQKATSEEAKDVICNYLDLTDKSKPCLSIFDKMNDYRYWPRETLIQFIEKYKHHTCLWKVKSDEYKRKHLKNEAYDDLVQFCKKLHPDANREFVVKKIQSLRSCFRKEMNKVIQSKKTSTSEDQVYQPILWYFDLLMFTKDQDDSSNYNDQGNFTDINYIDGNEYSNDDEHSREYSNHSTVAAETDDVFNESSNNETDKQQAQPYPSINKNSYAFSRKRRRPIYPEYETDVPGSTDSTIHGYTNEFEAIGINVGKKIQRMPPAQAIYAETLINKILASGLLNKLKPSDVEDSEDERNLEENQALDISYIKLEQEMETPKAEPEDLQSSSDQQTGYQPTKPKKLKTHHYREESSRTEEPSHYFSPQPATDPCGVYGQHVANKLRGYSSTTRIHVEHAINNVLFEADLGKYDSVTDYSMLTVPIDR